MNVKLCGLQSEEEIQQAHQAGATHVGLVVHAPASHRNLSLEAAAALAKAAPSAVETVLVTPTDDAEAVEAALSEVSVDVVQATGDIAPDRLRAIADEASTDAWKGLRLAETVPQTVARIDACAELEAVVLDALEAGYGGQGEAIDWGHAAAAQRTVNVPIVLAGGLTPANVGEAIGHVEPWCVDVSSGIETDEANDPDKMQAFVQAAREAAS